MNINDKIKYLKDNFNPYTILNVKKNDTNEKIEKEFKRLLIRSHPDRTNGNDELFQLIIKAYNVIYTERKSNMGINNHQDHNELRNSHKNYQENEPKYENKSMSSREFNSDRFNKIYSDNKLNNPYDSGYGNWKDDVIEQPKNVNMNNFNESFSKVNKNQIQKYIVPEHINAGTNIDCETLGVKKIDDFTKGFNINDNRLNYTDYKRALGGRELIIDNSIQEEKRDMKNYKSKREKCINEVNELEQNYYKEKEIEDKQNESNRLMNLHQMDEEISNHYSKVNSLMLSR